MIRRPPRSTLSSSSAASDVYKRQDQKRFRPVFQPVVDLTSHQVRGYEALTRFEDGLAPDQHFSDARAVGLGSELESAAVAAAIEVARRLPPEAWLSVNFSL